MSELISRFSEVILITKLQDYKVTLHNGEGITIGGQVNMVINHVNMVINHVYMSTISAI